MKVGDLVRFHYCEFKGQMGIISLVPKQSYVAKKYPKNRVYWVCFAGGKQIFTGNQLEVISESR